MLKVGLTGGIGCGKSTVSELFSDLGVPIIDADIIAHQLVEKGQPALTQLVQNFGEIILNEKGDLDRGYLRTLIFKHADKKQHLESLLHPLIYAQINTQIIQLNSPYCIICIPLLIETQKTANVDRVLVIDCMQQQQISRVIQRDALEKNQIEAIIATQASRKERLGFADDIIDNSKTPSQLAEQIKKLHNLYLSISLA